MRPATHVTATLAALAAVFFAGWALDLVAPAQAQMACGDHDKLVALVASKYGEVPHSLGTTGPNLAEFFLSPTGSWSLMISEPSGTTCIIASGNDWEIRPPTTVGKPT